MCFLPAAQLLICACGKQNQNFEIKREDMKHRNSISFSLQPHPTYPPTCGPTPRNHVVWLVTFYIKRNNCTTDRAVNRALPDDGAPLIPDAPSLCSARFSANTVWVHFTCDSFKTALPDLKYGNLYKFWLPKSVQLSLWLLKVWCAERNVSIGGVFQCFFSQKKPVSTNPVLPNKVPIRQLP